jgi:hypothetical protein
MIGTLEKLSHAELTNTPPKTAHATVAEIQHILHMEFVWTLKLHTR